MHGCGQQKIQLSKFFKFAFAAVNQSISRDPVTKQAIPQRGNLGLLLITLNCHAEYNHDGFVTKKTRPQKAAWMLKAIISSLPLTQFVY